MKLLFLILSLSIATALSLSAQTVILKVPIEIKNMPAQAAKLSLQASFTYKGNENSVGQGTEHTRQDIPLVNGAYSGTVPMTLTQQSSAATEITGYKVELRIFPVAGPG